MRQVAVAVAVAVVMLAVHPIGVAAGTGGMVVAPMVAVDVRVVMGPRALLVTVTSASVVGVGVVVLGGRSVAPRAVVMGPRSVAMWVTVSDLVVVTVPVHDGVVMAMRVAPARLVGGGAKILRPHEARREDGECAEERYRQYPDPTR